MSNFHIQIKEPKEIIPRLGKGERHWKQGRSAYELSTRWMQAGGIPSVIRTVLQQAPEWKSVEFLEGIFERETELPGRGRPSQTDLLAIVKLATGNAVLGIEGKVDEPFGSQVDQWLAGAEGSSAEPDSTIEPSNRSLRLQSLCSTLAVDPRSVGNLYYQLFHRTCAALYEAKRFGYRRAAMLVHSFAPTPTPPSMPAGFVEFAMFAAAVGMPVAGLNSISPSKVCDGIEMRLGWVSDTLT